MDKKCEFEFPEIIGVCRRSQGFNAVFRNRPKQRVFRSLLTEALYSMPHSFNRARAAHTDKSKGRKNA